MDLYPFEKTVAGNATESEIIEKIDIGGIALIRAAAKNFNDIVCLSDKADYELLFDSLQSLSAALPALEDRKGFCGQSLPHLFALRYCYFQSL